MPEDLSLILSDQDLVESSMDLSSKDILKRCETFVRSKVKKSHSLGDLEHQWAGSQEAASSNAQQHQHHQSKDEGGIFMRISKSGTGDVHHPFGSSAQQSVPVMIQKQRSGLHPNYQQQHQQQHQHHRHLRQHSSGTHGLSTSNPTSSSSSTLPMRIPERPQAVSVGGGKGATPMSL